MTPCNFNGFSEEGENEQIENICSLKLKYSLKLH